jgi:hypothetical protein
VRLLAQPDFRVDLTTGWPDPMYTTPANFSVSAGTGWCYTTPGDRGHLEDFRAVLPAGVATINSVARFSLSPLPTLGEVTHGFVFETDTSSYFTELVHRPGQRLALQAGQVMTPFPLTGTANFTSKVLLSSKRAPWPGEASRFYGVRNRVDIDQGAGTIRWRTKLWRPDLSSEPTDWFQDVSMTNPELARPGQLCVQFDQSEIESKATFKHGCRELAIYAP